MMLRAMRALLIALFGALIGLWLPLTADAASEPSFPALTGRVVDAANILSAQTEQTLTGELAAFEAATSRQVVIVTVPDLQGYAIDDYGTRLGRAWGIGQRGKNTGALLIVAPKERSVRIEVGYGLEGELTDAQASQIIQQTILPRFRQNDFNGGVSAGTAAVLAALGWSGGSLKTARPSDDNPAIAMFVPVVMFGLFLFLMIGRMQRYRRGVGTTWNNNDVWRAGRNGGFGGGFGSGGFGSGGGGFSGGGGSFGGGGASGRW